MYRRIYYIPLKCHKPITGIQNSLPANSLTLFVLFLIQWIRFRMNLKFQRQIYPDYTRRQVWDLGYKTFILNVRTLLETQSENVSLFSQYSGWATGWTTGVPLPQEQRFFSSVSGPAVGPNWHPIQKVSGVLVPGVKRTGREDDHSFSSS
jgi:hypothetical protein